MTEYKMVPDGCRQKLIADGKAYPKSSCASCGPFSPKWKECDAMLAAAPEQQVEQVPDFRPHLSALVKACQEFLESDGHADFPEDELIDATVALEQDAHAASLRYAAPLAAPDVSGQREVNIDAAAKVVAESFDYPWDHMPEQGRETMRKHVRAVIEAAYREQQP